MHSPLVVRHLVRSTLAGTELRTDAVVVRLGRGKGNDVVFDAHRDLYVSERHAEVRRRPGGGVVVVDLGSSNGTFVNGARLEPGVETPVGPGDDVSLGGDAGPLLRAFDAASENDAPDTQPAPRRRETATDDPGRRVGSATLRRIVDDAARKERRRTTRWLATILALVAAGAAAVLVYKPTAVIREFFTERRVEVPVEVPFEVPVDKTAALHEALYAARGSVYVVLERTTDAEGHVAERPFGTAWSCAPGLLATNVHVAEEVTAAKTKPHAVFTARSGVHPPVDLALTGARLHPGYAEYLELRNRYTQRLELDRFDVLKGGCDVALLEVAESDVARQAPPLRQASEDDLRKLDGNAPVGYVGFPMEGRGINWERPAPVTAVGGVTSLSDFFLGTAPYERSELIAVDAEGGGGASGSPLFGAAGTVVGILHAVDLKRVENRRVKTAGGQTYAQRIDILRELMEDRVAEAHPARSAAWRASFKALFAASNRDFFEVAELGGARRIANAGLAKFAQGEKLDDLWEEIRTTDRVIERAGDDGAAVVDYTAEASRLHLFAAVPTEEPVNIDFLATNVPRLKDVSPDFLPYLVYNLPKAETFTVRVGHNDASVEGPVAVRVKVFRLKR